MRPGAVLALLAALPGACGAPPSPAPAARLTLREPGVYRIDAADLWAAGLGWERVDPQGMHLFADGKPRVLWPGPDGGWPLRFAAEGGAARGAGEDGRQAFLLVPGPAPDWLRPRPPAGPWPGQPPLADAAPWPTPPAPPPGGLLAEQTVADRRVYEPLRPSGERWLGPRLTAPGAADLAFDLSELAPGAAQLGLWLRSETEAPADPDHRLTVALNGRLLADWSWDGTGERSRWLDLPADAARGGRPLALEEGPNRLTLTLPGLPEVLAEVLLLDHVLLRYPIPDRLGADRRGWLATAARLELPGLAAGAAAWPLAGAGAGGPPLATADAQGRLRLAGLAVGQPYEAASSKGARRPETIERAGEGPDLRAPGSGADWLAVVAPSLIPELAPLARRREAEGLRTAVVNADRVWEQFGAGAMDGAALAAFLRHAAASWRPAPRYVLLVGDATEDPAGHLGPPAGALLPTGHLFGLFGGWVASDLALSRGLGDAPGGVAIGRLPARSPEELRAALRKLDRWEAAASSAAAWRRRALIIADPSEAAFAVDAARFAQDLGRAVFDADLAIDGAGAPGAPAAAGPPADEAVLAERIGAELRRRLDQGQGLTVYLGHGSRGQWGRDRLLDQAAAETLANAERPGLVVNLSCLTGAFTHPTQPALAETLLLSPQGGAAAVIAPSSLTLAADQAPLAAALARALGDPATARLGDALVAAWRAVPPTSPGAREVALTFLLFGDPALRLGP